MSLISELLINNNVKILNLKIIKKCLTTTNSKNIYKYLLTDGIEFLIITQFGATTFSAFNELSMVCLKGFIVEEEIKNTYWVKLNKKNFSLSTNSASEVYESTATDIQVKTQQNIVDLQSINYDERSIISMYCIKGINNLF